MGRPHVTAIIACYNSSPFLRATLESACQQDYGEMEILAINDGSTDDTAEILQEFAPRIRSINNRTNSGQYSTLNIGIRNVVSEFIAFLDHDDLWHPEKIKKQVEIFSRYPEVSLVYTNGWAIDEGNEKLFKLLPAGFQEKNRPETILLNCYIKSPTAVMVRKDAFQRVGLFRPYLPSCGDHDMWVRISETGRLHFLEEDLIYYRIHPEQLSERTKRRMWQDGFIILREACRRYPYGWGVKRRRLAVLFFRLARCDRNEKMNVRAIKNYLLAGLCDPRRALNYVIKGKSQEL